MKKIMGYKRYIIIGAVVLIVFLALIFGLRSCGVSHKSPEGVARSLIKAYANGNQKKIKDCYGAKKDTEESLQKEIDATIRYFDAHNLKDVEIKECDVLSENDKYTYVYVTYDMQLENSQSYPCINTYMTDKEDGRYYILSSSKVTDDMRKQAASDYAKFMTTNTYKNYVKEYETFTKKNPGYEDKIAGKLS
ncbi:hypothetical protein ACTNEW_13640 [Blautia sp. HCP3S3_G3]|uniref:hypothetical protein n=1 Tax=Blautia sp. HCP3S3_G3 TaxID=3438913 RepID=UPI003F8C97A0